MILKINWEQVENAKLKDMHEYINNNNLKESVRMKLWVSDDNTSLDLMNIYINKAQINYAIS